MKTPCRISKQHSSLPLVTFAEIPYSEAKTGGHMMSENDMQLRGV